MDVFTVSLETPAQAHGQTVDALHFRPITGRDIFESGFPYKMQFDTKNPGATTQIFDTAACRTLMSRSAQVPTSTIDGLSFHDWNACLGAITHFLARSRQKTSSTDVSTSESSGAK